jgi:hypothetical protein
MKTIQHNDDQLDESQSLQVIKAMIEVSHRKLRNDGILFVLWGWIMCIGYSIMYIMQTTAITYTLSRFLNFAGNGLLIIGLLTTAAYIWWQRKKVQTYIGISLRYVWVSMVLSLVLVNVILFNVQHKLIAELQHPVFMVIIAFATVVTGGILRHKMIILGGIVFGGLALLSSYIPLNKQLLMEAIAWLIAFVIPGHVLLATRSK